MHFTFSHITFLNDILLTIYFNNLNNLYSPSIMNYLPVSYLLFVYLFLSAICLNHIDYVVLFERFFFQ